MITTTAIHIDRATTSVQVNETGNGLVLRPVGQESPRYDLFFGSTPNEIRRNLIHLVDGLDELDTVLSDAEVARART